MANLYPAKCSKLKARIQGCLQPKKTPHKGRLERAAHCFSTSCMEGLWQKSPPPCLGVPVVTRFAGPQAQQFCCMTNPIMNPTPRHAGRKCNPILLHVMVACIGMSQNWCQIHNRSIVALSADWLLCMSVLAKTLSIQDKASTRCQGSLLGWTSQNTCY